MCYTRASNGPLKWCIYLILLCIAKQTNKQTKTRINEIESFLCIRSSYYESMNMNNEWEVVRISPLFFDHFHLHRPHLRGVSENQKKKNRWFFGEKINGCLTNIHLKWISHYYYYIIFFHRNMGLNEFSQQLKKNWCNFACELNEMNMIN